MCVKTYLSKGIITGSVGLVLAIAFPLIQWLAVPAITDSILRKVNTQHTVNLNRKHQQNLTCLNSS